MYASTGYRAYIYIIYYRLFHLFLSLLVEVLATFKLEYCVGSFVPMFFRGLTVGGSIVIG